MISLLVGASRVHRRNRDRGLEPGTRAGLGIAARPFAQQQVAAATISIRHTYSRRHEFFRDIGLLDPYLHEVATKSYCNF